MNAKIGNESTENYPMALQPKSESDGIAMSEEEYLRTEPDAEVRHEYIDGRAYAMSGASTNHIRITANITREFGVHLKGKPCEVLMADMKAKVAKDYVYPDVVVVCNHTEKNGITDSPVIIFEVLSQSTRKRDFTTKLILYINLPSLQEYVLVEQEIVRVTVLRKMNGWKPEEYSFGDSITFESIAMTLPVEEIYDRVDNQEMREWLSQNRVYENNVVAEGSFEEQPEGQSASDIIDGG